MPADGGEGDAHSGAELGRLPAGHHGLSREEVAESQRERLLSATAELIGERGYAAAPITEIVKRASVANRVFYENFEGKEEAFIAVFDILAAHVTELVSEAAAAEKGWPESVVAGLRAVLRFFEEEPMLARFCLIGPFTATPKVAGHCREVLTAAIPYLVEGRELSKRGGELPASTEDSLLGGVLSQLSRAVLAERPLIGLLPDLAEFVLSPYMGVKRARALAAKLST